MTTVSPPRCVLAARRLRQLLPAFSHTQSNLRIVVTGDRNWHVRPAFDWSDHFEATKNAVDALIPFPRMTSVWHGDANGADWIVSCYAESIGCRVHAIPANWDRWGKRAGPLRNQLMLDTARPHLVLAFHEDIAHSKGTLNCIQHALERTIPVLLFDGHDWILVDEHFTTLALDTTLSGQVAARDHAVSEQLSLGFEQHDSRNARTVARGSVPLHLAVNDYDWQGDDIRVTSTDTVVMTYTRETPEDLTPTTFADVARWLVADQREAQQARFTRNNAAAFQNAMPPEQVVAWDAPAYYRPVRRETPMRWVGKGRLRLLTRLAPPPTA